MRLVARVASWILLVALATAALVLVVPILRGEPSRLLIVSGHSMDPTFHTGDLVVAWPDDDYEVGDVAPYRVPEGEPGAGGLVIHRIIGGDGTAGFVMQGDNNPTPDIWMPRDEDIVGRQVLVVPRVGELMAWVRQPAVLAALVAGLVTAVTVSGGLSRRDETEDDGDEPTVDLRGPAVEPTDDGSELTTVS
jgi:signal peptidase